MRLGLNAYEGFQGGYARGIVRCWERRCCCRYKRRIPPPHLFFSLSHTHTTSPARRWLDDGRRDYFFPRSFFLYFSPHRLRQSVTFSSGGRVQVTFTHGVSRDVAPSSQWRRWRASRHRGRSHLFSLFCLARGFDSFVAGFSHARTFRQWRRLAASLLNRSGEDRLKHSLRRNAVASVGGEGVRGRRWCVGGANFERTGAGVLVAVIAIELGPGK